MVFALIGAIIGYKFLVLPNEESFGAFLNALATVGAVMASFAGVSISIFLLLDSDVTKALRKHGYYKILMNYAHWAVLWSLLLALAALVGFVISLEEKNALYYRTALCGVLFYAFGTFYRILALLRRIGGFFREEK